MNKPVTNDERRKRDRNRVTLHRRASGWSATFEAGPERVKLLRAGGATVPLPFTTEAQPSHVEAFIAGKYPGAEVRFDLAPGGEDANGSAAQRGLFGQTVFDPMRGRQMPLFHEPVSVPVPKRDAVDERIARKFDPSATPSMWEGAEVIHAFSRAEAIADGVLVDLDQHPTPERPDLDDLRALRLAHGISYPAAMTSAAFFQWIKPTDQDRRDGQSITGRLHDLWTMYRYHVARALRGADQLSMEMRVWTGGRQLVARLKVVCGTGDDGAPVLTFMLPEED